MFFSCLVVELFGVVRKKMMLVLGENFFGGKERVHMAVKLPANFFTVWVDSR